MIIGICGKSGSGKSTLARNIKKISNKDCVHLDVDTIGHMVLSMPEVKDKLIIVFGKSIIDRNVVDRKKLGDIVFNSREKMDDLTRVTWELMQVIIDEFISENKDKVIILDWLLLPITKYFEMCDIKVLLDVPYEIRKKRAMKRDNISSNKFDIREKASLDLTMYNFDYVLKDSDDENIKKMVKTL